MSANKRTGDELYNYLCKNGALPVETVQKIFTQLVGAVAYIHSKSCVHRDLKLENVLLDKHDNVKLCDFGFTREYEGKANYLQTFCGTICYSAPEMLKGEKYAGEKVDVWSLGIILYALLKGELPFDEDDDAATKAKILKDDPVYPDTFPEAAKTLISKLLSKRPLYRPTLSDILAEPFLTDHAPQQQAILKLSQPAAFTTQLEKETLERMKSAGVDIDKVIENVLAQRCDALAGWWALLIEKESRKQARKERKRKERDAEMKILRRLSGASSRLERIAPTLMEVDEEQHDSPGEVLEHRRSTSRGRTQRRSTPQILVSDLPQLPEGDVMKSPESGLGTPPPPPIDKDSLRSQSGSRPPLPPKERKRRSSTLQLVTTNPDVLGPLNGVNKRRNGRFRNRQLFSQLTALKHWFVESAKRAKSPVLNGNSNNVSKATLSNASALANRSSRTVGGAANVNRSSVGSTLTPVLSNSNGLPGVKTTTPRIDTTRAASHRKSLSPSPITPRSSYRRSSTGLRGRKSTSSSVSSIRSMPRHGTSHSKASSQSSNSIDTIHSPTSRNVSLSGRSPHSSIKVLPVTPTANAFSSNPRLARTPRGSDGTLQPRPLSGIGSDLLSPPPGTPQANAFGSNVMFARRKKSPFKGPTLNSAFFSASSVPAAFASPAIVGGAVRQREGSDGKPNLGLKDFNFMSGIPKRKGSTSKRKSQIIEEEEEDEQAAIGEEEEEVEEVEAFQAIHLNKGERLDSITIWNDAVEEDDERDERYEDTRQIHRVST